jgi:hypothetical protein
MFSAFDIIVVAATAVAEPLSFTGLANYLPGVLIEAGIVDLEALPVPKRQKAN